MSPKTVADTQEETSLLNDWQAAPEKAPSTMRQDEPWLARWIGLVGLGAITLGGVALIADAAGRAGLIGPSWGTMILVAGLGALLYHAVSDSDVQVRRTYLIFGLAWLVVGLGVSLSGNAFPGIQGDPFAKFVPYGILCFLLGLLFTLAPLRKETQAEWHDWPLRALGGLGGLFALVGFVASNVSVNFLLPSGFLLILLGLVYLSAFVGMIGVASDLAYRVGLGIGALGGLAFLVAGARSLIPALASAGWIRADPESYLMPAGLLLMGGGLLYLAVAAGLCSDNNLVVMTRRELGAIFYSPIAYIFLIGFVVIGWYLFSDFVYGSLWREGGMLGKGSARSLNEPIITGYIFSFLPIVSVIFVVPVITMRLLSEENRTGTLEVLLTAPLGETVVVLSKFLAAFCFYLLVWVPLGLYLVSLRVEGGQPFDYRPVISFALALAFSGASFVSMGLFFSSLTRSQVGAAIFTFVGMCLLTLIIFLRRGLNESNVWNIVVTHVSYLELWNSAMQGRLAVRDLVFQLSAAVFWLFLTVKVLESRKWR